MLRRLESATEIRVEILTTSSVAYDPHIRTVTDRAFLGQLAAALNVKRTRREDSAPCACAFYVKVSFDGTWGVYVPGGTSDMIVHKENFALGLARTSYRDFLVTTVEPTFLRALAARLGVEQLSMLATPLAASDSCEKDRHY
jgi:hypothetical protein